MKKPIDQGLELLENIDIAEIIKLARATYANVANEKEKDWNNFRKIFARLTANGEAETFGIKANNALIASGVFFVFKRRAYYIIAGNKVKGNPAGASHRVIDAFIRRHADTDMILDFEGSSVPGIAFFFKGFGSEKEEYPWIKYNALPAAIRLIKR